MWGSGLQVGADVHRLPALRPVARELPLDRSVMVRVLEDGQPIVQRGPWRFHHLGPLHSPITTAGGREVPCQRPQPPPANSEKLVGL